VGRQAEKEITNYVKICMEFFLMFFAVMGLVFDVFGVALLSFDLVRLQRAVRERGKKDRARFNELESKYGGIESWASEIEKSSRWNEKDELQRAHIWDDEVSFNTRNAIESARELASTVSDLAARVEAIAGILKTSAGEDNRLASESIKRSFIGAAFLTMGFVLQIIGVLQIAGVLKIWL